MHRDKLESSTKRERERGGGRRRRKAGVEEKGEKCLETRETQKMWRQVKKWEKPRKCFRIIPKRKKK